MSKTACVELFPKEKTFEVELIGTKPLLMHDYVRSTKVLEEWKAKGVSHPPGEVEAESGLYSLKRVEKPGQNM